jgi:hypothetical protein
MDGRMITSKPPEMRYRGKTHLGKTSMAITLIHPGRGSPASVSPLICLMSRVRMTLTSVSGLQGNCLSKRKTTWVRQRASGESEHSECILSGREMRWRSKESESSKCCENDNDLRTVAGLQVPGGIGEERHTLRKSWW